MPFSREQRADISNTLSPWFLKRPKEVLVTCYEKIYDWALDFVEQYFSDLGENEVLFENNGVVDSSPEFAYDPSESLLTVPYILAENLVGSYYTPSADTVLNVDSVTPTTAVWSRAGNVVTVSGAVAIAPSTAEDNPVCTVRLSLPFLRPAGAFTDIYEASGVASAAGTHSSPAGFGVGEVRSVAGEFLVELRIRPETTEGGPVRYTYQYLAAL